MRGLIISILIMLVLIAIGIVASMMLTSNLNSKIAAAQGSGIEAGRVQGYAAGFQKGSVAGYQKGSQTSYAMSQTGPATDRKGDGFYFTYNPTHAEAQKLLADKVEVSAWQIHDYAEANGMRMAYVRVQIARPAAEGEAWVYRLVAFDTVDRGLVIIEPWSHKVVALEVGQGFQVLNGFPSPSYDDTITKITIIW